MSINLSATFIPPSSALLEWSPAKDKKLTLQRSEGTGAFAFLANIPKRATRFEDINLTPNTKYNYRIGMNSNWSNTASITTTAAAPPAPTNLTAVQQPAVFGDATAKVNLSWQSSVNGVTFEVQCSLDGGSTWQTLALGLTATSYTDTTAPFSPLQYRVRAIS